MSTEIAVVAGDVVGPEPTLQELAAAANREHEEGCRAARGALVHWLNAGEALLAAKKRIGWGEWTDWLVANFDGPPSMAKYYVRIATYRPQIESAGITSVEQARLYVRGLPPITRNHTGQGYGEEYRAQAAALREAGASFREIGRLLGVSSTTVQKWLDPKLEQRQKKRSAEWRIRKRREAEAKREAERQGRIKRAVRKAGAATAEAWAMAERFQDVLAQAQDEAQDHEAREALARAGVHYRRMRDEIVRALGVQ
jgi:predicted transcriptional regulator